MDIDKASPAVSPRVVANILMTQNIAVSAGTLLSDLFKIIFNPLKAEHYF